MQKVQPYLFFAGDCAQAVEFYRSKLGAKVNMLMRYSDSPEPPNPDMCPPGKENGVMHAAFEIGDSLIMASDDPTKTQSSFTGFMLSLSVANEAEADHVFGILAEGGQIKMPLMKTFYSPRFGMLADKFGVGWMVIVPAPM